MATAADMTRSTTTTHWLWTAKVENREQPRAGLRLRVGADRGLVLVVHTPRWACEGLGTTPICLTREPQTQGGEVQEFTPPPGRFPRRRGIRGEPGVRPTRAVGVQQHPPKLSPAASPQTSRVRTVRGLRQTASVEKRTGCRTAGTRRRTARSTPETRASLDEPFSQRRSFSSAAAPKRTSGAAQR